MDVFCWITNNTNLSYGVSFSSDTRLGAFSFCNVIRNQFSMPSSFLSSSLFVRATVFSKKFLTLIYVLRRHSQHWKRKTVTVTRCNIKVIFVHETATKHKQPHQTERQNYSKIHTIRLHKCTLPDRKEVRRHMKVLLTRYLVSDPRPHLRS